MPSIFVGWQERALVRSEVRGVTHFKRKTAGGPYQGLAAWYSRVGFADFAQSLEREPSALSQVRGLIFRKITKHIVPPLLRRGAAIS